MRNQANLKNSFICHYWENAAVIRDSKTKYYVTQNEYNQKLYGMINYPTQCACMAVIMAPDLINRLMNKSNNLKIF